MRANPTWNCRHRRQERRSLLPLQPASYWQPLDLTSSNHDPCRGSSIGRACGSYNSKEINLKVVGSSPTFGYSYIKAHQSSCPFAFWLSVGCLRSPDQVNSLLALLARSDERAVTVDRSIMKTHAINPSRWRASTRNLLPVSTHSF